MPLRPQTIGRDMSHGFSGSYARQPDMIVTTATLGGAEDIPFGMPLVRGQKGEVIPMGAGNTGNQFIGVAGREVKSASEFYSQNEGRYGPGEPVSVFQRGCINVRCRKGAPAVDGAVYVRVTASGGYQPGDFEAEADGENTVALVNAQWGGPADGNGVAELRIAYVGPVPAAQGTAGPQGPKGDPGPLLFPWYNRKNIALTWDRNCEGSLFTPELAGEAEESFRFLKPYYDYFLSLRGDPAPDASR